MVHRNCCRMRNIRACLMLVLFALLPLGPGCREKKPTTEAPREETPTAAVLQLPEPTKKDQADEGIIPTQKPESIEIDQSQLRGQEPTEKWIARTTQWGNWPGEFDAPVPEYTHRPLTTKLLLLLPVVKPQRPVDKPIFSGFGMEMIDVASIGRVLSRNGQTVALDLIGMMTDEEYDKESRNLLPEYTITVSGAVRLIHTHPGAASSLALTGASICEERIQNALNRVAPERIALTLHLGPEQPEAVQCLSKLKAKQKFLRIQWQKTDGLRTKQQELDKRWLNSFNDLPGLIHLDCSPATIPLVFLGDWAEMLGRLESFHSKYIQMHDNNVSVHLSHVDAVREKKRIEDIYFSGHCDSESTDIRRLERLLGANPGLIGFSLYSSQCAREMSSTLKVLGDMSHLKTLSLSNVYLSEGGLAPLSRAKSLEVLLMVDIKWLPGQGQENGPAYLSEGHRS
jgi:hypothetical protein